MDNPEILNENNDWTPAYNPVHYEINTPERGKISENNPHKKHTSKPLLMITQIIICVLILLSLYGIKTFGKDLFKEIDKWYKTNLNNEIIVTENFENFSLDKLIDAVKDK